MKRTTQCIVLLALAALPRLAAAGPPAERPRDRARTFLVVRLAEALKLSDEEALKLGGVIRQSDERRQQLITRRWALEERLTAALEKTPPDTTELAKLVAEGSELDQQLALVPEDTFRELQKTLTIEQQARLIIVRRELQGEVRRAMHRRLGGTPPREGRPR
jgi:hypothetical protein